MNAFDHASSLVRPVPSKVLGNEYAWVGDHTQFNDNDTPFGVILNPNGTELSMIEAVTDPPDPNTPQLDRANRTCATSPDPTSLPARKSPNDTPLVLESTTSDRNNRNRPY